MFTLDGKKYDENKIKENEGKVAIAQISTLNQRGNSLALEINNVNILKDHYADILKKHLPEVEPEEVKVEEVSEEEKK